MSLAKFNFVQEDIKSLLEAIGFSRIESLKNQYVCITGGAGFLGTWISELIWHLNQNHGFSTRVLVIDKQIEKIKTQAPHLSRSGLFEFVSSDIRGLVDLPKELNYIIHAAGLPDSRFHLSNPVETMNVISQGTDNVLRCCDKLSHLKMFLNLSSSLVYGSFFGRELPIKTNECGKMDETSISNVYAVAKKYSETQTVAYKNQYRIPVCILRPFTFVGPYQSLQGPWAINNFISDALAKRSIKVLGHGDTQRSFLYGSDAAFWILSALVNAESGAIFNLGSSQAISMKNLADMVRSHVTDNTDVTYVAGGGQAGQKNTMLPFVDDIKAQFGLTETVSLKTAIERTIRWNLLT